jgi:hypothetical protein
LSQATEGYLYELVAQMILSTVSGITDGAQTQDRHWAFAAVHESGCGPGCVKSRTDGTILFVESASGATDVRLCGGD